MRVGGFSPEPTQVVGAVARPRDAAYPILRA